MSRLKFKLDHQQCQYYIARNGCSCRKIPRKNQIMCHIHRKRLKILSYYGLRALMDQCEQSICSSKRREISTQIFGIISSSHLLRISSQFCRITLAKALEFKKLGFQNPYYILKTSLSTPMGCVHATLLESNSCVKCLKLVERYKRIISQHVCSGVADIVLLYLIRRTIGSNF